MSNLGETLRERRTALGISLETAESATRIRSRLLEALEAGDYDRLPNPGYVRGYISSYARYLELDPVPLLAMYKAETGAGRFHELNLVQADEAVKPSGEQHAVPWRAAMAVVLVVALAAFAVWAVVRIWRGPEPPAPQPTEIPTSTAPPATGTATQSPAVANPQDTPAQAAQPFTLKVAVAADGASWVEVKIDGKPAYAGTMTSGQSKTFEVAKEASLVIGKPDVVTVTRDGKEVAVPTSGGTGKLTLKAEVPQQ